MNPSGKLAVTCLMLTADRPHMADRAIQCFAEQDYENKRLLIWDTGKHPIRDYDLEYSGTEFDYILQPNVDMGPGPHSIGALRNAAVKFAIAHYQTTPPAFIAHFDDDDYSHPERLSEQVQLIESTKANAVGYSRWLMWDETSEHAWRYTSPGWPEKQSYLAGGSLLYSVDAWQYNKFPDVNDDDTRWQMKLKRLGLDAFIGDEMPRFISRYHGANAGSGWRLLLKRAWNTPGGIGLEHFTEAPEYIETCRKAFA